jgi:hypothetical protein
MRRLFGGVAKRLSLFLDEPPHIAHTLGALGLGSAATENIGGSRSALFDCGAAVALTDAVAVADVQEAIPDQRLRLKCM